MRREDPYASGSITIGGNNFKITPDTYVPTNETMYLVNHAVKEAQSLDAKLIVEVGTGCGFITHYLAKELPDAQVIGVDISTKALKVAKENVTFPNTQFVQGNYVDDLVCSEPDVIIANLPWGSKYTILPSNQKRDLSIQPKEAIFHPNGPMGAYEELFESIYHKGWKNSVVLFETGTQSEISTDRILPNGYNLKRIPFYQDDQENYSVSIAWRRKHE